MKSAQFKFFSPTTVERACELLHEYEDAKVMAGGQSLVPMLNMRLARPEAIIDISRIDRLKRSGSSAEGSWYGSAIVHSAVEDRKVPDSTRGLMPMVASGIGYRAIRNRGTIGGSLSHADASAEWPVVMAALNAQLICQSVRGARTIAAREYVLGYFTNALEDDEMLTEISVPALATGVRWGFCKTARKPGEFSESLAVALVSESDGVVTGADVWLGAAGDSPRGLNGLTDQLRSRRLAEVGQEEVLTTVAEALERPRDEEGRYQVRLHGMTVWRALTNLEGDA